MASASKIEWCDASWNPILGCTRVSSGCINCYAERTAHKLAGNPNPKIAAAYEGLTQITNGRPQWTGKVRLLPERLDQPLHWKTPRRIFVNSMSDLFHEEVDRDFILRVFMIMRQASWHQFQILTKRPERMQRLLADWLPHAEAFADCSLPQQGPAPNIWLGVSVEDQKTADERIPFLISTPAAVRFLSCEPLLGPVDLGSWVRPEEITLSGRNYCGLHWIITGAESGFGARPMELDWVRAIRNRCMEAEVPFFLKQFADARGRKIHTPELDGRRWLEYPDD